MVTVTTLDDAEMTQDAMTELIGDALRIAPGFYASAVNTEFGIETALEARYRRDKGRYIVVSVANQAIRDDFDPEALRRTTVSPILRAAIPKCMAVDLERQFSDSHWVTVSEMTESEGRLLPQSFAREAVKRGAKQARMEAIQIIYGVSALAGLPPVKAVQDELGVPHRTASDWIATARKSGWLEGMNYAVGRQAES
jgi:hypothetical protein